MADNTPTPTDRIERVLAAMVASIIALSLLCFVVLLVAGLVGTDVSTGLWPVVAWIPYVGLPVGFLLIVTLLLLGVRRRGKAAKDAPR